MSIGQYTWAAAMYAAHRWNGQAGFKVFRVGLIEWGPGGYYRYGIIAVPARKAMA